MPKVNVYLPDRLAEQVKEYDISLSSVCQAALAREVERAELRASVADDIAAVARRLRLTETAADDRRQAAGEEFGAWWAREHATVQELEELRDLDRGWVTWDIAGEDEEDGPPRTLGPALAVEGYRINGYGNVHVEHDDPYIAGLIEGALDVLRMVDEFNEGTDGSEASDNAG